MSKVIPLASTELLSPVILDSIRQVSERKLSNILKDRSSCAFEAFRERNLSWKLLERMPPVPRSTRSKALRVETTSLSGSVNSFSSTTLWVSSTRTSFSLGGDLLEIAGR